MKNVQVDSNGELRCWKCGAMAFTEKRTLRAKVLGGATVGVGALLAKKKLRCQACGEYNDVGSADPFKGHDASTATSSKHTIARPSAAPVFEEAVYTPRPIEPVTVKAMSASVEFDGENVTVKKSMRKPSVIPLERLRGVVVDELGKGVGALWFATPATSPPERGKFTAYAEDPNAVMFQDKKRPAVDALLTAIEGHRN